LLKGREACTTHIKNDNENELCKILLFGHFAAQLLQAKFHPRGMKQKKNHAAIYVWRNMRGDRTTAL
jgi:hypothetical protein